jgi:hypothetical protein
LPSSTSHSSIVDRTMFMEVNWTRRFLQVCLSSANCSLDVCSETDICTPEYKLSVHQSRTSSFHFSAPCKRYPVPCKKQIPCMAVARRGNPSRGCIFILARLKRIPTPPSKPFEVVGIILAYHTFSRIHTYTYISVAGIDVNPGWTMRCP